VNVIQFGANKLDIHNLEDSNLTQIYQRPLGKGEQSKMIKNMSLFSDPTAF
jgi:hypothetical protein